MPETDQPEVEIRFLRESQAEFDTFKSIVDGLSKHLFPQSRVLATNSETTDVEIAEALLASDDIKRYLRDDFIEMLQAKLTLKARGIIKQGESKQAILTKVTESK